MVPHLGLLEKGFAKDEYEVKMIGLGKFGSRIAIEFG
jgi:hypothetical protein